jgi:3-mercaptopyruvate sulfurtransferase SseA
MPGSTNIPFQEMLDPEAKTLLEPDKLRQVFESKKLDPKKPMIASCGTGVTAAILEAALSGWQLYNATCTSRKNHAGQVSARTNAKLLEANMHP